MRLFAEHKPENYEKLLRKSFLDMGFSKVLNSEQFSSLIIDSGLSREIPSISDKVSLHRASQVLGKFLIFDFTIYNTGYSWFRQKLLVSDAFTSDTLLEFNRHKILWSDYDAELVYPLQNLIKRWVDDSRLKSRP